MSRNASSRVHQRRLRRVRHSACSFRFRSACPHARTRLFRARRDIGLLLHLNEIERRQLHLEQGYSSMFDYCTSGLGYSEPAAVRRIRTARCVARFPDVFKLLESNKVSLGTVARISRVLTEENKDSLLARVCRCSLREVDAILAELEPTTKLRDIIRAVVVEMPAPPALLALTTGSDHEPIKSVTAPPPEEAHDAQSACESSAYRRSEGDFHPTRPVERRVRFHFSTSESFQQKLDKVKSLAWHRLPANPSLESVFELVMDAFIKTHDPVARHERREKRGKREAEATTPANASEKAPERFIPAAIRDEVFARDGSRCAFVAHDGRRCQSTLGLQVDHIVPVAHGGTSTPDNLRLLCAHHNRFEAEQVMGRVRRRRARAK